jgi:hypothetical protein
VWTGQIACSPQLGGRWRGIFISAQHEVAEAPARVGASPGMDPNSKVTTTHAGKLE